MQVYIFYHPLLHSPLLNVIFIDAQQNKSANKKLISDVRERSKTIK